ncbi:dihydrofolate reductase [Chitinophaga lutea]|uniref:Dihydrofolate reductase n=1 Tax=Chitinophaga lutea TaxID=2488634 RepID=A0A3N4PYI0_9BACT|nr:dihydrofolate reductase family protein [Chitinophaga lutea]RPE12966.1 dihydrofolate reductase [Chitinophaga lutea]
MGKTILNITMSLDGFIAGKHISAETPMGENGELLHKWMFEEATDAAKKMMADFVDDIGAVILGSNTYNTAIEDAWGGKTPFQSPAFVLTTGEPKMIVPGFTHVNDRPEKVLLRAKEVAGGKNVWIMGGANVAQQFLRAALVDELHIHIATVLLGGGTALFPANAPHPVNLIRFDATETPGAAHLFYKIGQ